MKKVFALLLCIMLVVACFSGCGEVSIQYSGKTSEVVKGFTHSYGNLLELDVGFYEVTMYGYWDLAPSDVAYNPAWLAVSIDEYGEKHFDLINQLGESEEGAEEAILKFYS